MKKTQLTLLSASMAAILFQPSFAQAKDVTKVYGQVRVSIDNNSSDFGNGKKGLGLKSNSSRLGVKGSLDTNLTNTRLIYQAEMRYGAADEKTAELEWREGYVGLVNKNLGKLRLGRTSVGYKTTLTKIDPWNDNIPQSRQGGQQGSSALHSSYFNNAIDYVSPKVNGIQFNAFYATQFDKEGNASPGTGTPGGKGSLHNAGPINSYVGGNASGFGVRFSNKTWFFSADSITLNANGGKKLSNTKAAGKVTNGTGYQAALRYKTAKGHSVAVFYEDVTGLNLGTNQYINGIYKLGHAKLIATYGTNSSNSSSYYKTDSTTYSLGAKYMLNKKSELFIAYNNRDTGSKTYATTTMGINAKFGY